MNLLIELYSEDIPVRFQKLGAIKLLNYVKQKFEKEGINLHSLKMLKYYSTRRISVLFCGLPESVPEKINIKRGPRCDLQKQHLQAFSKRNNIDLQNCPTIIHNNIKYYSLEIKEGGQKISKLISEWLQTIIKNFSWTKQMRFAEQTISWVRPLRHVFVMIDNEVISGNINMSYKEIQEIPFAMSTIGHFRFNKESIKISNAVNYAHDLNKAGVMIDAESRLNTILSVIDKNKNMHLDESRIIESASLAEWVKPVILHMPTEYNKLDLNLISEVLWQQQKILVLKNEGYYEYLFVLDRPTTKGIDEIKQSLDRVVRARLDDALELLNEDRITFADIINSSETDINKENSRLSNWLKSNNYNKIYISRILKIIEYTSFVFRVNGIKRPTKQNYERNKYELQEWLICEKICLLRLMFSRSAMIEEYPQLELQLIQILYKKRLMQDDVFSDVLESLVAQKSNITSASLDDKLEKKRTVATYVFAESLEAMLRLAFIHGVPSGSNDPFALRNRSQEIIVFLQQISVTRRFNLKELFLYCSEGLEYKLNVDKLETLNKLYSYMINRLDSHFGDVPLELLSAVKKSCYDNFADLLLIVPILNNLRKNYHKDLYALSQLSRRIRNILAQNKNINSEIDEKLLFEAEEISLYKRLNDLTKDSDICQFNSNRDKRFEAVLRKIINISSVLEMFFDAVMVNVDDKNIRNNRLALLQKLHFIIEQFADFSAMANLKNAQLNN